MIIRKMDSLGRIVLPSEIRKKLNLNDDNDLKLSITKDNKILIEKSIEECFCCHSQSNLKEYNNIIICTDCITKFD